MFLKGLCLIRPSYTYMFILRSDFGYQEARFNCKPDILISSSFLHVLGKTKTTISNGTIPNNYLKRNNLLRSRPSFTPSIYSLNKSCWQDRRDKDLKQVVTQDVIWETLRYSSRSFVACKNFIMRGNLSQTVFRRRVSLSCICRGRSSLSVTAPAVPRLPREIKQFAWLMGLPRPSLSKNGASPGRQWQNGETSESMNGVELTLVCCRKFAEKGIFFNVRGKLLLPPLFIWLI